MSSSSSSSSKGLGFTGALTIAFIILKLTNVISWSWFWVLSPIWISICIWLIFIIAMGVGFLWLIKEEK